MFDAFFGGCAFVGLKGEHGDEPACKFLGHRLVPLVLVREDLVQWPRFQLGDVPQLSVFPK